MADRSTKKQRELLSFIDGFIKGNGYGPSYREVMRALDYKSVSTVAVHVDGLIKAGYLRKRDHSARSLEVVTTDVAAVQADENLHISWLRGEVESRVRRQDESSELQREIEILEQALNILDQTEDKPL
jgi:repressor LexA